MFGELGHARRGDLDVRDPDRLQLVLDAGVGCSADQERVDVVVARDAGIPEPLDLVQGHLRDPVLGHVQDRRVVREVDQRRCRDRGQRVVGCQEGESPRPVGIVVVLCRHVLLDCRRPDVLRDRDRLFEGIRAVEAGRRLGRDRRHERRRLRGRRNLEVAVSGRSAERVLVRIGLTGRRCVGCRGRTGLAGGACLVAGRPGVAVGEREPNGCAGDESRTASKQGARAHVRVDGHVVASSLWLPTRWQNRCAVLVCRHGQHPSARRGSRNIRTTASGNSNYGVAATTRRSSFTHTADR